MQMRQRKIAIFRELGGIPDKLAHRGGWIDDGICPWPRVARRLGAHLHFHARARFDCRNPGRRRVGHERDFSGVKVIQRFLVQPVPDDGRPAGA